MAETGATSFQDRRSLGGNEFIQLAEESANKILSSDGYLGAVSKGVKPRIVLGRITNNSHNEQILVRDMYAKINEILVASGTARMFEPGTIDFDYIISPILTSTIVRNLRGRTEYTYTLQLKLTTQEGEQIGVWSVDRTYLE